MKKDRGEWSKKTTSKRSALDRYVGVGYLRALERDKSIFWSHTDDPRVVFEDAKPGRYVKRPVLGQVAYPASRSDNPPTGYRVQRRWFYCFGFRVVERVLPPWAAGSAAEAVREHICEHLIGLGYVHYGPSREVFTQSSMKLVQSRVAGALSGLPPMKVARLCVQLKIHDADIEVMAGSGPEIFRARWDALPVSIAEAGALDTKRLLSAWAKENTQRQANKARPGPHADVQAALVGGSK